MKKVILWITFIAIIFAIVFGTLYLIDMNRIKNNKSVVFSTWGYDYAPPVGISAKNDKINLTLEVVKTMVVEKGDRLTWSDFEKYKSKEIGSGLYILLYELDENYNLLIGGVPNEKPMYIRLVSKKDNEQYIDIRYDNINEFISKTNSKNDWVNRED